LRISLCISFAVALLPAIAGANGLTDLHATLGRLSATAPVHGTVEIASVSHSNQEKGDEGRVSVRFEAGSTGLHLIYPPATLAQATEEARKEARDPEVQTPVRTAAERVRPLHISELVDAATALDVILESAQFVEMRPSAFDGRPARLIVMKVTPKISKSDAKHLKKLEGTLSVWIAADGAPIAAELSSTLKGSFLVVSFDATKKENWTYTRTGDRLSATRYEKNETSSGLGQHTTARTVETLRLE